MSYQSTLAAMNTDINPPGSAGSALLNPAAAGAEAMQPDPLMNQLKTLITQRVADASANMVVARQAVDAACTQVTELAQGIPANQLQAYAALRTSWLADPTNNDKYLAYSNARLPIYQAGLPLATPAAVQAVVDADVGVQAIQPEYDTAIDQYNDLTTHESGVTSLIHGDSKAEVGSTAALGVMGIAQAKLESITSDIATLSGGEAAVKHAARVDGIAPEVGADVCGPSSLIRKGMKALTDAGKLLKETGAAISQKLKDMLGPVVDWTMDKLRQAGSLVKDAFSAVTKMVDSAKETFDTWVKEGAAALTEALTIAKNKAFMSFLDFDEPCVKETMKDVMNMKNVDEEALARARATA